MKESNSEQDSSNKKAGAKDSTSTLPMVSLEEALTLVGRIREEALETASLSVVATKLGYATRTSTPFYRRWTAARLFGLVEGNNPVLSQRAMDYLKPHDEEMVVKALADAIMGIPAYAGLVNRYRGKKLHIDLLANGLVKEFSLTDTCARICAKIFEASLRFGGMLSDDGSVMVLDQKTAVEPPLGSASQLGDARPQVILQGQPPSAGSHQQIIYLDKEKTRSFTATWPLEVTRAEYTRICKWLEFAMLIADDIKENQG